MMVAAVVVDLSSSVTDRRDGRGVMPHDATPCFTVQ